MKDYSVSMALVDFIPVILFLIGSVFLLKRFYPRMSKGALVLFAAGTIDVISAGSLKALYKLLYALKICNFESLSDLFFPLQSIGFLLAGLGLLLYILNRKHRNSVLSAAVFPEVFKGTFIFVSLMVLGLGLMDISLCIESAKQKKRIAVPLFILSFLCSLGMGYLSTKDFELSYFNWIAEGVNIIGQLTYMLGALCLFNAQNR